MFNDRSQDRFQGVDPRLVEVLRITRERTGIPFEVSEGLREIERQRQLVAEGKSQTMNSRHLTGNATDIHIVNPDGSTNWDFEAYRPIADTAKLVAAELGYDDFVWGGDWKTLKDGVHFQIGGNHVGHSHPANEQPTQPPQEQPFQYQAPPENALARQPEPETETQNALYAPAYRGLDPRQFMSNRNRLASMSFDQSNPYLRALT